MNRGIFAILILTILSIGSCDTASNVKPREENFFIKFYEGKQSGEQFGEDIIETRDGGLLIAGTSYNNDGSTEILVIKTDNLGREVWTYGARTDLPSVNSYGKSVIELKNGGFLVGGTINEGDARKSVLLIVNDSILIDSTSINTSGRYNSLSKVTQTHDYIVASGETSVNNKGGFIAVFNEDLSYPPYSEIGSAESNPPRYYFGTEGKESIVGAYEVFNKPDDNTGLGYVVFGSSESNVSGDGLDYYMWPFTPDLSELSLGTSAILRKARPGDQNSYGISRLEDRYSIIGHSSDGGSQMYLESYKIEDKDWDIRYGPIGNANNVIGRGVAFTSNGRILVVGDQESPSRNIFLARIDQNNPPVVNLPWPKQFGSDGSIYQGASVATMQDGSIVTVGTADLNSTKKIVVIKTGPNGEMSFN